MPNLPHDISDLHLAPVVLALDARIEELGALDLATLVRRIALDSDAPSWSVEQREAGLLEAARHAIDCHGWTLTMDVRGVRLSHGPHTVVLGVPPTFAEYLAGSPSATVVPEAP